jgi:RNase P subunit RPR2
MVLVQDTLPIDPLTGWQAEVRAVQPYQATKRYLCPGCNQFLEPGTGHVVVIPEGAPDLRRHWHRPCWNHRQRRHPGRTGAQPTSSRRRQPPRPR